MAAAPVLWAVGRDVLWCLGLGLLLAGARDLASILLGNGRLLCFVWDVLAFAGAAVLLCGFAASASAGGGTRWYMAAGLGVGALAWRWAVSGALHGLTRYAGQRLLGCANRIQAAASAPFVHLGRRFAAEKQKKMALKAKKSPQKVTNRKKQLQKQRKILYN